ncbi:MAG: hypothetical protein EON96_22280 [Caulobacteraceae bacterium]|nr:MAG: hypothetical protein EON96_22280 [Caulobacteraceae bacterium]
MSGGAQEMAARGGGQERVAPRGDYRDSCSGEYVNRGRLYADCRTRNNQVRGTSIELNRCSDYEIRNSDGLLVCGPVRGQYEDRPGGGNGPGPGGPGNGGGWGGRASITVYRDANFRGATYTFNEEIPNLANSGMNDAISSMQLRGDWEVCTDAYFRGNCQVIRQDVRNLQNWGLNDRISSLRPARRGGR